MTRKENLFYEYKSLRKSLARLTDTTSLQEAPRNLLYNAHEGEKTGERKRNILPEFSERRYSSILEKSVEVSRRFRVVDVEWEALAKP